MPSRPRTVLVAGVVALVLFAPSAHAQRGFGGASGGGGARGGGSERGGGFPGRFGGRGERGFGLGWGFLPPYYSEEGPAYWPPAQPQYIPYPVVVQQPQPTPQAKPVEPLMMEERDGKWVRVQSGSDLPAASQGGAAASTSQPPPSLPSAVVVFRDGHQEEVAKYMIEGNALYLSADYWTTGTWTRKISISDLDVAATLKLNQERGTKFALPSSPGEVMVRF